jgi:hypothetical protein
MSLVTLLCCLGATYTFSKFTSEVVEQCFLAVVGLLATRFDKTMLML